MVNFRYHLASLVAVFLSLGLGLLIGASLAEDEGLRKERTALIKEIEASLDALRAENMALQSRLSDATMAMGYYDEVLALAGEALVGTGLHGKHIALFIDGGIVDIAQEVRTHLRRYGASVSTYVWNGQTRSTGAATPPGDATQLIESLAALLMGVGSPSALAAQVADGTLQFDGGVRPADAFVIVERTPSEFTGRLVGALSKGGARGLLSGVGSIDLKNAAWSRNLGWPIIPFVETQAGRVQLATTLAMGLSSAEADRDER